MPKNCPETRQFYKVLLEIPTRWMDNDLYGHVNNTVYYSYFDTAINTYLVDIGKFNIFTDKIIGVCAESHCTFLKPIHFPDQLEVGINVSYLGSKSVRYELALFCLGQTRAVAKGWFVHVFVNRKHMETVKIPKKIRTALLKLQKTK
ncbi:MAG: thioesterase [Rhodospirillaceae bacterium]|nr:thioesterase [Rhodospirillaceae bacterium]